MVELRTLSTSLSPVLCELLNNAIAINSIAFEDSRARRLALAVFAGSNAESALLSVARDLGWANSKSVRDAAETLQVFPFSSECKAMGVFLRLPESSLRCARAVYASLQERWTSE